MGFLKTRMKNIIFSYKSQQINNHNRRLSNSILRSRNRTSTFLFKKPISSTLSSSKNSINLISYKSSTEKIRINSKTFEINSRKVKRDRTAFSSFSFKLDQENKIFKLILITLTMFIISWLPYSIIVLIAHFGEKILMFM